MKDKFQTLRKRLIRGKHWDARLLSLKQWVRITSSKDTKQQDHGNDAHVDGHTAYEQPEFILKGEAHRSILQRKVESEPLNGSNADIPNQCESEQALNVSAGTLLSIGTSFNPIEEGLRAPFLNVQMMSDHNSSDLAPQRQEMYVENVSSGLVPQGHKASDYDNSDPVPPRQNVVPTTEKTDSSQQGLEFLFSPLLEEYYNP
ncbi:hypothetical protein Tco_0871940, partial [Tanacetum coccineum]